MMGRISEILQRKIAGVPVWVITAIGILILAWWLKRRQAAQAASQDQGATPGTNTDVFPNAQPMPWTSDVFVNIKNPPATVNVPVTVNPAPVPVPPPPKPPAPPPPAAPPPPPPKQTSITYVVRSGDTLWGIATRLLGSGATYTTIYNANKAMIEAEARKHGFSSSGGGHWIFPGEVLVIPK